MPFSPAQLEAIQIRNKNVIVSASAEKPACWFKDSVRL